MGLVTARVNFASLSAMKCRGRETGCTVCHHDPLWCGVVDDSLIFRAAR